MEIVRDVESFVEKNGKQLLKFFKYKTGIFDEDLIHEHIQDFYLKLIQTKALEAYDEKAGEFETYVLTLLCWMLPYMAKKNVAIHHSFLTSMRIQGKNGFEVEEIWDHVSNFEGLNTYKICSSPCTPSSFTEDQNDLFDIYVEEFKEYIDRTESASLSHQMHIFIDLRQEGFKSTDIAKYLNVSDNMVKFIKQKLQKRFELWKRLR